MAIKTSDAGQDRWVIDKVMREKLASGYQGFFIEAGAADGLAASNTLILEQERRWSGVLVEPNQYFFERLVHNRPGSRCFNCVLSDADGEIEFIQAGYLGTAPDHVRPVFEKRGLDLNSHTNYQQDVGLQPAKRSVLPARTLRSVLGEVQAPEVIDYFSLDVEGGEVHVLNGFPWGQRKIACMTVEVAFFVNGVLHDADHRPHVHDILTRNGMKFVGRLQFDDCFIDPTLVDIDVTP